MRHVPFVNFQYKLTTPADCRFVWLRWNAVSTPPGADDAAVATMGFLCASQAYMLITSPEASAKR